MIFVNNKYTRLYFKIISYYKLQSIQVGENHHIIPKSLGGSNSKENKVKLPLRAHFIVHRLLVKMTTGEARSKMTYALVSMKNRCYISSRTYESLKSSMVHSDEFIEYMRQQATGRRHSKETREKLKKIHTGSKRSEETKQKMKLAALARWDKTSVEEKKCHMARLNRTGIKHTDEAKLKMKRAHIKNEES